MKIEMDSFSLTNVISNLANSVLKMRLFNRRNYRCHLRRSTGRVEDQSVPNYA